MKWVNGYKTNLFPIIDSWEDFPKVYFARFKGDDPRSGWVDSAVMTAKELHECDYSDYWEWLDESPDPATPSAEVYRKALEVIRDKARKMLPERFPAEDGQLASIYTILHTAREALSHSSQAEEVKGEELDFDEVPVFSLKQVENLVLEFGNMVSAAKGKGFDMPNDSAEFVHEKYKIITSF